MLSVIFIPLLSFFIIQLFGRFIGTQGTYVLIIFNMVLNTILSFYFFYNFIVYQSMFCYDLGSWISLDLLNVTWSFNFDSSTLVMLVVVNSISVCAHIFSIDYMKDDPHQNRFLSYLSLFTFFMLILISSGNLIQLFIGWEGVGLCSYLLINFWYNRFQSNKSAMKAMVVNKVGDIGYLVAIFFVYYFFKSFDFHVLSSSIYFFLDQQVFFFGLNFSFLTVIGFFFFLAAIAKSAQIGLHTWLPDAMEGPTPVSSLIHAATMVTAGIFLVIRCSFFYEFSSLMLLLICLFGGLTCFVASFIGLFQNDIKKIIAYSTCSQLGYMFFCCGLSGYHISFFHLFTHAFFKALLFLTSGTIIHSLANEQDLRKMGGLYKLMPFSYICIIIGSLSLMGFPFLSGFFSKDLILELAFDYSYGISFHKFFFWFCTFSLILSVLYSVKVIFLTFFNHFNGYFSSIHSLHPISMYVLFPLSFLCFFSVFSGFMFKDLFAGLGSNFFVDSIFFHLNNNYFNAEFRCACVKLLPIQMTLYSFYLVYILSLFYKDLYIFNIKNIFIYKFFNQKLYFDFIYNNFIAWPMYHLSYSSFLRIFDKGFIEWYGPYGIVFNLNSILLRFKKFEYQYIYHYCGTFLIGLIIFLVFLNQAIYYPLPFYDFFYKTFN